MTLGMYSRGAIYRTEAEHDVQSHLFSFSSISLVLLSLLGAIVAR